MAQVRLDRLGLHPGEPVRFRKSDRGHWHEGKLVGVELDGSLLLHDRDGAARSLRPERLEVRRPGRRGRLTWQCIADVAVTWEQLSLWD